MSFSKFSLIQPFFLEPPFLFIVLGHHRYASPVFEQTRIDERGLGRLKNTSPLEKKKKRTLSKDYLIMFFGKSTSWLYLKRKNHTQGPC